METFADRVRNRRNQLELSQDALAKAAGISQSTVAQIESGRNEGSKHLLSIADALSVTPRWLVDGGAMEIVKNSGRQPPSVEAQKSGVKIPLFKETKAPGGSKLTDGRPIMNIRPVLEWEDESELGEEYVLIPRLDIKVSAGNGRIVWEIDEKGQKQAFRKSWVARLGIDPGQAATVVADGSSMEPRIIDGDSLIVDYKATRLVDGKIYVLAYQNEVYVKRLFKKPGGGLTIRSDNPDKARYPDMDVLPEHTEHVQIIARVVGLSGTL